MKAYDYNGKKNLCGVRIREARLKRKYTQADLAARMQLEGIMIERDTISRIEMGARFVGDFELLTISKVLGRSIDWLVQNDKSAKAK